jgi:hypothetical protein
MDLDEMTPAGGGSLRGPAAPPAREPVATFTRPPDLSLDEIWHGGRTTDATRGGTQGIPFGYRPGHSLGHEPIARAERGAFDVADTAGSIRTALRPGSLAG